MAMKTLKLTEAINEIGNALTAAGWPVMARKATDNDVKVYDTKQIYKDLTYLWIDMGNMEYDYRDCVNELCLKCGNYHEAYVGACDGCRWKTVKEGFR